MCIGGNQAFGITHTINFKTMTAFNTDYNNTELLDQELTIEELEAVAGGKKAGPPRARKTGWVRTGGRTQGV